MRNKLALLALASGVFIMSACNYNYVKTDTGLLYKIFNKGSKKLEPNHWLKVHYSEALGDSVLYSTFEHMPVYGRHDTSLRNQHHFVDFMDAMKIGDSAVFVRSVDTLVKRGQLMYNEVFKKGQTIKGKLVILGMFDTQEAMQEDQAKETELEKEKEIAGLEKYLQDKKITNAQRVGKGVLVVVDKPGTGIAADSGDQVKVMYTGYLKNGSKFDSNMDSSFYHTDPFVFTLGTNAVIQGWDEGLRTMKQGTKARLFIPAMLAYGPQSQGEKLPSFSDLIFEVELLEVTKGGNAPAEPKAPGAGGQ